AQLQDTLRTRYSEFLRDPELEVAVLRRVVVNGEVKVPNVYLVDVSSTVRDVIAKAGGLTESGSASRVSIVRDGKRLSVKGWERVWPPRYRAGWADGRARSRHTRLRYRDGASGAPQPSAGGTGRRFAASAIPGARSRRHASARVDREPLPHARFCAAQVSIRR